MVFFRLRRMIFGGGEKEEGIEGFLAGGEVKQATTQRISQIGHSSQLDPRDLFVSREHSGHTGVNFEIVREERKKRVKRILDSSFYNGGVRIKRGFLAKTVPLLSTTRRHIVPNLRDIYIYCFHINHRFTDFLAHEQYNFSTPSFSPPKIHTAYLS